MRENQLRILKEKAEAVKSAGYQTVKKYQLDKILNLASSNIDPLELKGMLKLIASTNTWINDYEKEKE